LSPFLIPNLKVEDYLQSQFFPFLRTGFLWRDHYKNQIKERIAAEEKWPDPTPKAAEHVDKEKPLLTDVSTHPATKAETAVTARTLTTVIDPKFQVSTIQREFVSSSIAPPPMLIESMNFIFNKWYRTSGFGAGYFESNRKELEEIINYCLKNKWRPVLITIPISNVLLDGLLDDYMQVNVYDNITKTNLHGVNYFDFTHEQLTKNNSLFSDSDHLNQKGAAAFSYVLLRHLIDNGYLPNEADGYDYKP